MGTLVYADGPCILTAAHVWERLEGKKAFGVAWQHDRKGRLLNKSHITPRVWPKPANGWGESGPDVALLGLSTLDASDFERRDKSFYDLSRARSAANVVTMWTPIGAPAEEERKNPTCRELGMYLYPSDQSFTHEQDGFDYIDIKAYYGQTGRPRSYGGVSGSGLWRFGMVRSLRGSPVWDDHVSLEGVVYWEDPRSEGGFLRSHGLKSVERTRRLKPTPDPLEIRL